MLVLEYKNQLLYRSTGTSRTWHFINHTSWLFRLFEFCRFFCVCVFLRDNFIVTSTTTTTTTTKITSKTSGNQMFYLNRITIIIITSITSSVTPYCTTNKITIIHVRLTLKRFKKQWLNINSRQVYRYFSFDKKKESKSKSQRV